MSNEKIKAALRRLDAAGVKLFEQMQTAKSIDATFRYMYQEWYTGALRPISMLAPDRLSEFKSYYEIDPKRKFLGYGTYVIQDYLKGVMPSEYQFPDFDAKKQVLLCGVNQLAILQSVVGRIDSVLDNIRGELFSSLQEEEISTALALKNVSLRASGALSGVIVERHLFSVASNRGVKVAKKNPSISDYNDALRTAEIIDMPTWRKISYLADIRNLCSHKKDNEPSVTQVDELLDGVVWLTKNVN